MAFCPNCGTPNTDQADKCTACGFELAAPKQKAKFKGTIMMSGIKVPTADDKRDSKPDAGVEPGKDAALQPTEPPPPVPSALKPSLPPPSAAAVPPDARNANFQKTMMGHAPVIPPARDAATPAAATPPPSPPTPAAPEVTEPARAASSEASRGAPQVFVEPEPANASVGSASSTARVVNGAYDSTMPPSAPPATPKPAKVVAIGCAVALALFCVVGGTLYYVVGAKIRQLMGQDDTQAEAAAWQASIVQSLVQVSELCKSDCSQASVYFHPLKKEQLLVEARSLTTERLQKFSDASKTKADMLNGTDDESFATKLGLDPQQCARVTSDRAKVISCSVPDPGGRPSELRIVELSGVNLL